MLDRGLGDFECSFGHPPTFKKKWHPSCRQPFRCAGSALPYSSMRSFCSSVGASLIIAVFWDLWHIPLYLNGFYPGGIVGGLIGQTIYIIPLAIVFTWLYNRTGGNLFLILCFHTMVNVMDAFIPHSDLLWLALWVIFSVVANITDKMYRRHPKTIIRPENSQAGIHMVSL